MAGLGFRVTLSCESWIYDKSLATLVEKLLQKQGWVVGGNGRAG